jgi:hypothetical protein
MMKKTSATASEEEKHRMKKAKILIAETDMKLHGKYVPSTNM